MTPKFVCLAKCEDVVSVLWWYLGVHQLLLISIAIRQWGAEYTWEWVGYVGEINQAGKARELKAGKIWIT